MNEDKDGNIWSAGGDGCLIKWNKSKLLKGLLNDVKVHEVKERNIFKKNSDLKIKKEFVLEIDNTVV